MPKKSYVALFLLAVLAVAALALFLSGAGSARAAVPFEVIASGLNNPRGLAFGADGALYVTEAGNGGVGPCFIRGDGQNACYGPSGAIYRIMPDGTQDRLVDDMPSTAPQAPAPPLSPGDDAMGPHDIVFDASGEMYITLGWAGDPAGRAALGAPGADMAQIAHVMSDGSWMPVADIGAYEVSNNPNNDVIDSNPYGLVATSDGLAVADAGGNSLLHVDTSFNISTVTTFVTGTAEFPPGSGTFIPMHQVPTTVIEDTGGYFVGQLTGFPFPPGGANIFHVVSGFDPTVHLGGFTNIIDIMSDGSDGFYVVEISTVGLLNGVDGAVIHVDGTGSQTVIATDGLIMPGGVAMGPDGALYVTNFAAMNGLGQVIRIPLAPTGVTISGLGGAASAVPFLALATAVLALAAMFWLVRRSQAAAG